MQDWYREPTARIIVDALRKAQEAYLKLGWQHKRLDIRRLVDPSLLPY
jgi:hypothetical protein